MILMLLTDLAQEEEAIGTYDGVSDEEDALDVWW